ncbi:hypothetical protein NE237_014637 [Protea cynaroides]|uniref:Uncharacterized protein n=1 Tax=Protea cynaroides TaxID=273540 RepID=A0A9Q0KCQ6_9MAGN|nr:hypothetical protein NE237_014637 [Protea cynaroides]
MMPKLLFSLRVMLRRMSFGMDPQKVYHVHQHILSYSWSSHHVVPKPYQKRFFQLFPDLRSTDIFIFFDYIFRFLTSSYSSFGFNRIKTLHQNPLGRRSYDGEYYCLSDGRHPKMSSLGTSKGVLEIAKFAVYVSIPIALMFSFASNTENLKKIMGNRSYVVYPPEGPPPPSPEEIREMAREIARKNNMR